MNELQFDCSAINWEELRKQKQDLEKCINMVTPICKPDSDIVGSLHNLVNLIDFLQEATAKVMGEEAVYGDMATGPPMTAKLTIDVPSHLMNEDEAVEWVSENIISLEGHYSVSIAGGKG